MGVGLGLIAVIFMVTVGWLKLRYDRQVAEYQENYRAFCLSFLSEFQNKNNRR
jgi:ATP-binding cassette subfamily C protein